MRLIKLDAIDSTNDFLKRLSGSENVENFTVVTAENQTRGKGQMGNVWNSETGKNLIMSVLVKNFVSDAGSIFNLNIAFSVAVIESLKSVSIPQLSIKWPNDILSGNKKIGGILIESIFKSDAQIQSILGLGLNVNQTNFENLPKASSLALVCKVDFDKMLLLDLIAKNLQNKIENWTNSSDFYRLEYERCLFKIGVAMAFQSPDGTPFMGIIMGVSPDGKLLVQLENNGISDFGIKEIQLLY